MKYIQSWYRGELLGPIHVLRGPWQPPDARPAANMVKTWCGTVLRDRSGLLPDQEVEFYPQGIGSDHANANICSACQEVLKIHAEYPGQLAAMDNETLYQEFRDAHRPDDYDGCFTTEGDVRLDLVAAEMEQRLRGCGFLSKEETDG